MATSTTPAKKTRTTATTDARLTAAAYSASLVCAREGYASRSASITSATPPSSGRAHVASAAARTSERDDATATAKPAASRSSTSLGASPIATASASVQPNRAQTISHAAALLTSLSRISTNSGFERVTRAIPASSRTHECAGTIHLDRILDDARGLRRAAREQRLEVVDQAERHAADRRVEVRLGTILIAEELVVLVRLVVPALAARGVQGAQRRYRAKLTLVDAVTLGSVGTGHGAHHRSLVADEWLIHAELERPRQCRAVHATGRDDHRHPSRGRSRRIANTGMQLLAIVDRGAVEIEHQDPGRERRTRARRPDVGRRRQPTERVRKRSASIKPILRTRQRVNSG